jgi:uncharacterized protein YndB with AHSA1/START domain
VSDDRIEREIFVRAGIDHVWSLISKAGFWIGDELRFDVEATPGATAVIDAGRHGRFPVRTVRLEPPRYAAYRWASAFPGAEPTPANSTLIEFTLLEQADGVTLRVVESGFARLAGTPDFRAARRRDNVAGWATQLARLRVAGERAPVR